MLFENAGQMLRIPYPVIRGKLLFKTKTALDNIAQISTHPIIMVTKKLTVIRTMNNEQ